MGWYVNIFKYNYLLTHSLTTFFGYVLYISGPVLETEEYKDK